MISESFNKLSSVSLAVTLGILFIMIVYYALKRRGIPPGFSGLPYFGYWPFLDVNFHLKLDEMHKKYGELVSFTSTGRLYISLGSVKITREAYITKSECFGDRMLEYGLLLLAFRNGVIYLNGERWKVIRKFFLGVLKERGSVSIKNSMSGALYDSIKSSINDLKARKGKPFSTVELLNTRCSANIRLAMFGDIGVTDEKILRFNDLYVQEMLSLTPTNMLASGNFPRYFILPFNSDYRTGLKCHKEMESMLYEIVEQHKKTYDEENIRNIIDEYFKERNKRRSKKDPTAKYFTDEALVGSLVQIVGDGVFAIAAFIGFAMRCLVENPSEQDKIYKEIVDIVGVDRQPTIEDKNKLTYLNAFILETLRISDVFTIFPSQECIKETTLNGYRIPKGAILVLNFYSAHRDPEMYEEPEKFKPSRFIQTEGKRRPELPVSFGVGKRACLGEGFTMTQIFLFVATIVQNFHLELPAGANETGFELFMRGRLNIIARPRDHK
ncbi:cytochrome P450 18a1 [Nephila pilipes]|uniref:Cytochrome P450 18a1 n=1 Tax=Nephila pilipes TaxID=299642 RepID=A0A8X6MZX7_NEPPI|nr:cytochrome P450 18a1 [Nephila pilipes]